ncbi:MAG: glycosyltransferase [Anaerolineae bacterium]|nr:glycosyltransferase [Anaerolineae bacterium]
MTWPEEKKIRLAHLVDNLDRGGTQTWLMILVKGLAELGFAQRIYCLNEVVNSGIVQNLEASGARVVIIGRPRLYMLVGFFQLYRDLQAWQPEIAQTILQFSNVLGRPLARRLGTPIIISSIQARNAHVPPPLLFLDRLTARWADLFIAVGRQAIPFAIAHEGVPPDKVLYIANSIEPDLADRSQIRTSIRAELGISAKTKVLGMVARLSAKKAQRDLLEAYAIVVKTHPNTALLLVGDGPLRAKLERQARQLGIERQVIFLGDRTDVPDLLAAMDLFAHPSLSEGMPHAVMEAMVAGLPVIASAVDGVQDLIVDGESGWLVNPAQPQQLARRIIFALENQALWPHLGQAAARRIASEFSPQKMVAAYSAVYRELLTGI